MKLESHQMQTRHLRRAKSFPAFITIVSPVRRQSFLHNRPTACLRTSEKSRSAAPSVLSAIAAALLAVPLFSSQEARNHPQYRKFAPSAAATAVAASLLLRPRRNSPRRSTRYSTRDESSGHRSPNLNDRVVEPQTGNSYTTNIEAWNESKEALANGFASDSPQSYAPGPASSSSSTYSISYRKSTKTEGNGVDDNIRDQQAMPMDTSSIFAHMRAEFVSEPESNMEESSPSPNSFTTDQEVEANKMERDNSNTFARDQPPSQALSVPHPTLISTTDIMKWFVKIPVFLLSEVVVPIVQVSSILWYDCKQRILGLQNEEERRFFLENIEQSRYSSYAGTDWNENVWDSDDTEEDSLTDEERQIMEIQRTATTAYRHLSSTVRRFMGRAF